MSTTTALNGIVAEHVAAINAHDEDAIVATFADDAFVNDVHREFLGGRRDPPLGRQGGSLATASRSSRSN